MEIDYYFYYILKKKLITNSIKIQNNESKPKKEIKKLKN